MDDTGKKNSVALHLPDDYGWEKAIETGTEVLFRDLSLQCFYNPEEKSLAQLGYEKDRGGQFGWNIPDQKCQFDGIKGFVEDWKVGNSMQVKFRGRKVSFQVGMDFFGDQLQLTILDPVNNTTVDAGFINTCANVDLAEVYPSHRQPQKRIKNPNRPGKKFSPLGRYLQEFVIAEDLPYGTYILKMVHTWSPEIDPGGHDFNHLYSIKIE